MTEDTERIVQMAAIDLADDVLTFLDERHLPPAVEDAIVDAVCMKLTAHRASLYEGKAVTWARH